MPQSSSNTNLYLSYKWHIPNTNYEINIESSAPPIRLSLPIATLKEVYTLAMRGCLVKIAQGFGDSPSVSATFTLQDIRLDWVIPESSSALHYSMLLQVFQTLVNLHVRATSPLPDLVGEEMNFTVVDRTDGSEMGEGRIVDLSEADNEVLAKRSVDLSPAPKLLQTLASQRLSTSTSLRSKYVYCQLFLPCHLPISHKLTSMPLIQHYRPRSSAQLSHPIHSLHHHDLYIPHVGPTSNRVPRIGLQRRPN